MILRSSYLCFLAFLLSLILMAIGWHLLFGLGGGSLNSIQTVIITAMGSLWAVADLANFVDSDAMATQLQVVR